MECGFVSFIFMILVVSLVYVAWLWVREERRINRNRWQLSRRQLFQCNNCHLAFVPKEPLSLCRCPRCNTVCIRRQNDLSPAPGMEKKS